ncbi:serine hydrolase domain-containing protein [Sphingopyxis sp.]|uniref:serine hydrolase domain-containing protein n=1 Tax=Sphingopyxis sp. TaxID=1908224 RepID=UPI003D0CA220
MSKNDLHRREFLTIAGASAAFPSLAMANGGSLAALEAPRQMAIDAVQSRAVPSISVAVFKDGRPLWVEAFGWANQEQRIQAAVGTRYAIASATKPFTATAIMMLCEAGKMALADPIAQYLPGLGIGDDADFSAITVADVLQHRSGIARHWRNYFKGQGEPPAFSEVAQSHAFVTPAHRRRYLYSNLNYGLAAHAIEQITGQRYHDHIAEAILRPLGLSSATSLGALTETWSAARPYEEDGTPIPPYRVDEQGARDLVMTASDLARFGLAHLSGHRSLSGSLRRRMLSERHSLPDEGVSRVSYGLGWMVEHDGPAALFNFSHTGEGPGAASILTIVPRERLVVAAVANAQGAPAYRISEAIVDALSPEFATRRRANPFQERDPDPALIASFSGSWSGHVEMLEGPIAVRVLIGDAGASKIFMGDNTGLDLARVAVTQGVLSARAAGQLPGRETSRWPHSLRLHVERTDAGLNGTLAAYASRAPLPHDQFWLSHKIRLQPA